MSHARRLGFGESDQPQLPDVVPLPQSPLNAQPPLAVDYPHHMPEPVNAQPHEPHQQLSPLAFAQSVNNPGSYYAVYGQHDQAQIDANGNPILQNSPYQQAQFEDEVDHNGNSIPDFQDMSLPQSVIAHQQLSPRSIVRTEFVQALESAHGNQPLRTRAVLASAVPARQQPARQQPSPIPADSRSWHIGLANAQHGIGPSFPPGTDSIQVAYDRSTLPIQIQRGFEYASTAEGRQRYNPRRFPVSPIAISHNPLQQRRRAITLPTMRQDNSVSRSPSRRRSTSITGASRTNDSMIQMNPSSGSTSSGNVSSGRGSTSSSQQQRNYDLYECKVEELEDGEIELEEREIESKF